MYKTNDSDDLEGANLSFFCRECKQTVRGIPLTNPQSRSGSYGDHRVWLIVRCPTQYCELSFVIYDNLNSRIVRVYPLPNFDPKDYHEAIPEKVREDLAEARRCFYTNAFKGCVTLYRRAIQNLILDKISDPNIKNKKLWEQIDELFKQGFITKHLKDTAHEIRHFGNFGAHPSDDDLDRTTEEDAEIIGNLTNDLIMAIYITPYQTEQLKAKRSNP